MSVNTTYNRTITQQLHTALRQRNLDAIRIALQDGADCEKEIGDTNALEIAKETGVAEHLRIMIELRPAIAHKPERSIRHLVNHYTPLQSLAYWGRWDLVQAFVEANLITNLEQEYSWTDA